MVRAEGGPSEFSFLNSRANPSRFSNPIAAFESASHALGCDVFCRKTLIGDDRLDCAPQGEGPAEKTLFEFSARACIAV